MLKLSDINILDIGNDYQISAVVYSGRDTNLICWFPDEETNSDNITHNLVMDSSDWEKFLRQTDVMETEVLQRTKNGTVIKAILRKSQRQIDSFIQWQVFKRDDYACRWCGKDDVPLTVDHLILWEKGGPSIAANMVAACRKCNKIRGNMDLQQWLESDAYRKVSAGLSYSARLDNVALVAEVADIVPNTIIRSR